MLTATVDQTLLCWLTDGHGADFQSVNLTSPSFDADGGAQGGTIGNMPAGDEPQPLSCHNVPGSCGPALSPSHLGPECGMVLVLLCPRTGGPMSCDHMQLWPQAPSPLLERR